MKTIKLLSVLGALLLTQRISAQCTASFTYSLDPNGTVTFSNTSTSSNPSGQYNYIWNTGNSTFTTTSLSQTVGTTYTSAGTYTASVVMMEINGICTAYSGNQIIVFTIPGCPLSAGITAFGGSGANRSFQSTSTGTTASSTYAWSFGDGGTATGPAPSHLFTANGVYGYTLVVTNNATCSAMAYVPGPTMPSWISNNNSIVICAYTPALSHTVGAGGTVTFSMANLGMGFISLMAGDNAYETVPAGTSTFTHVYFNGSFTPTVHVYYPSPSCYFSDTVSFSISGNPCNADAAFTYTAGSGGAVQFSKTLPTSDPNISYIWKFGDGTTGSSANVTHTYSSAGNYSVSLISYHNAYPPQALDSLYHLPCTVKNTTNLNITGIPCVANASFVLTPIQYAPHYYYIIPSYPYNFSSVSWDWGDGTTSSGTSPYMYHMYSTPGNYNICLTVTTSCGSTGSFCVNQYLSKGEAANEIIYVNVKNPDTTTGISEQAAEALTVSLFPNPSEGMVYVQLGSEAKAESLEVFDLLGNCVLLENPDQREETIRLDVSPLNNGVYFLRTKTEKNSAITKFILSK